MRLLRGARRGVLTTIDARDGRPRSVPVCFVLDERAGVRLGLVSPLDEKRKAPGDPYRLRRVRNLVADPRATILVDHWDEAWEQLAFVELACRGEIVEPGAREHAAWVRALRERYPQYATHELEGRPLLRFVVVEAVSWFATPPGPADADGQSRRPAPAGPFR